MLRFLMIVLAICIFPLAGCEKEQPDEPNQVEITRENLDTEMQKMEQQIESDLQQQQ